MNIAQFPLLSMMIGLPLLGALWVGFSRNDPFAKILALAFAVFELVLTLLVLLLFNPNQGGQFQFVERYAWIPRMHIEFLVGVDGVSVLFLPLSALLTLLAMCSVWNSIKHLQRLHFALLLALESATLGVFLTLDTVMFFLFWELTLPPLYFLISLWGIGAERRSAAMKYTLFMLAGGVPLLFAILILALNHANSLGGQIPNDMAFSLPVLLNTTLPKSLQTLVFFLLLLGFAVKAPLVPLHTWLPTAAMEGPAQITALLTGLKLGVFGILRFALPLAPVAAVEYGWILSILGVVTLLYGALIALHQTNLRRLLAFASISHVGLVVIGIASLTIQGIQGALLQLVNFAIVASSLMLIAGFIHYRLGSTEAIHLGGLAKVMPRLTCCYFLFALASIGMPGTSGFPAELLLILSALLNNPALGLAVLIGAVLGAAYLFSFTRKAFWGPVHNAPVEQAQDLLLRELAILSVPALIVLGLGLFPNSVFKTTQATADAWLKRFEPALHVQHQKLSE